MATGRRPRGFWEELLVEVEVEGSVVEVAPRHGVSDRTLAWWCWKLRGERRHRAMESEAPGLLPVVLRDRGLVGGAAYQRPGAFTDQSSTTSPGMRTMSSVFAVTRTASDASA